jgi:hypothetical protein
MFGIVALAALVGVVTAPCDLVTPVDGPAAQVSASMDSSGLVTVHTADPRVPDFPDEKLKPGSVNYDTTIMLVGGLSPGESKPIPRVVGSIEMRGDRSLKLGDSEVDGAAVVRPGDKAYQRISSLAGPLKPNEWVALKAPPEGCTSQ